jgi:hypothetical protein
MREPMEEARERMRQTVMAFMVVGFVMVAPPEGLFGPGVLDCDVRLPPFGTCLDLPPIIPEDPDLPGPGVVTGAMGGP